MKQKKEVIVFKEDLEDKIPEHPVQFMLFWEEKINLIPEEFKPHAKITIESIPEYHCCPGVLVKIVYERLETDSEEKLRLEKQERHAKRKKEMDFDSFD